MPILSICPGCKVKMKVRDDYAGKKLKCPRCSAVVQVPLGETAVEEVKAAPRAAAAAPAPARKPAAAPAPVHKPAPPPRDAIQDRAPEEPQFISAGAEEGETRPCPECGQEVPVGARKCRHCKAWVEQEEPAGEEEAAPKKKSKFKPCPKCGATGAKRVKWTPWGSFYGPALFNHVRCPECEYAYNGKSGRSNLIPAIILVIIPLVLILGLIYVIYMILVERGRI
jgi:hypothetical protein